MTPPRAILDMTAHRPWPLPSRPWIMFQSWQQLLFAHWRVPQDLLRRLVPAQLELDAFEGSTWIGLAPFRIVGLRARFLPALPGLSAFPELNLRTYVRFGGRPGIHFFTLEAANPAAVLAARTLYRLPYRHADMDVHQSGEWTVYRSRRRDGSAVFDGRYRPIGDAFHPAAGTLEHFLTERYALYTVDKGGTVRRGDIHHGPWSLHRAEAEIQTNTLTAAHGIARPVTVPLLHYSERQDTLIWAPTRVR